MNPTKYPENWSTQKVKYVAALKSGDAITSEDINETGEYPVYGGNGLRGYTSSYNCDGELPLIGRQGALCGNINFAYGRFWASEHAVVVYPKNNHHPRWIGDLLQSMDLNHYSQSAAQPGISVEVIENLTIPVPPRAEQEVISSYIDKETTQIDRLIAEKECMLALLEEKRAALISRVVTRGLNPDVTLKDSGQGWLGEIPAHWGLQRLKQVAEVRGGLTLGKQHTHQLTELPYLRVANVQDGYLKLEDVSTVEVTESEAASYLLEFGDVLMNEGGDIDKLGRGCVWRGEISPCLHQNHVFAVRPHSIDSEWLSLWTSTAAAKSYFESRAKRSTNLASISGTNIKELYVAIPPLSERLAVYQHVSSKFFHLERVSNELQASIGLLTERRAALITAAVTGQISLEEMVK